MPIRYLSGVNVDSNTLVVDAANDRVGIGTASPTAKLEVNVGLNSLKISGRDTYVDSTEDATNANIYVTQAGVGDFGQLAGNLVLQARTQGTVYRDIIFAGGLSNGDALMTILGEGNVGIGTTSPTVTLEVSGRGLITSSGSSDTFAVTHSSGSGIGVNITKGGNGEGLYVNKTSGSGNAVTIVGTLNATTLVKSGGTASQYLMADGSVSTLTNPVTGTGTTNYVPKFTSASAIGDSQIFDNGTNVGIGTASPSQKLEVSGALVVGMTTPAPFWNALFKDYSDGSGVYISSINGGGGKYIAGNAYYYNSTLWRSDKTVASAINLDNGTVVFYTNSGLTANTDFTPSERMRITAAGNVGIGTTAPASLLHVAGGNIMISNTVAAAAPVGGIVFKQTNSTGFDIAQIQGIAGATVVEGIITMSTKDSGGTMNEHLRITSAGNVGIGTTAPVGKLHIAATTGVASPGSIALSIRDAGSSTFGFDFNLEGVTTGDLSLMRTVSGVQSQVMTFDRANGNVGIGTTAPQGQLSLNSQITNSGTPLTYSTVQQNVLNGYYTTGESPNLYMRYFDIACVGDGDGTNGGGNIRFLTNPVANDTAVERMRINYDGNVGIGTTSPATKLDVNGGINIPNGNNLTWGGAYAAGIPTIVGYNAGTGGALYFYPNGSTSGEKMRLHASGNLSIGNTNDTYKLDVSGQGRFSTTADEATIIAGGASLYNTYIANSVVVGYIGSGQGMVSGGGATNFGVRAEADLLFAAGGNAERMRILSGGNVGIGTTSPSEKLHVDGSTLITYNNSFQSTNSVGNKAILARVSPTSGIVNYAEYATATNLNGFVIGSDDARVKGNITGDSLEFITNTSTRMTVLSSGNVGINTTTPGSTLHVVGDVLIQTGALGVGVNPSATDGRIDAGNDIVAFSTSDKRLKENITPIANALEKVRSLTGVEFDWKEETKSVHGYEGHDVGVIAQDVQAVLPEAVRTNDTGYLSVRYEKMIALLIEANKELANRVEQLEKLIK